MRGKGIRAVKLSLVGLLTVILLGGAGFMIWASMPSQPMPEALAALVADDQVSVDDQTWFVFKPANSDPRSGLIFYPGGRVDGRAYAPLARSIAESGYLVVIVPMPLNLAIFGSNRAQEVIDTYAGVQRWAIGGHSLGGAMAARFAYQNPASVQGLVLMASYPASSDDLSDYELKVLSIYGTQDAVMADGSIEDSRALLPDDTRWKAIEGGNHAQFGWYGSQSGDGQATISRPEQQAAVVGETLQLLLDLEAQETGERQQSPEWVTSAGLPAAAIISRGL
jgi:pimeloyl-ACP methyl ester carboxylesterase